MLLIFYHDYIDCTACMNIYIYIYWLFSSCLLVFTGPLSTSSTSSSTIAARWTTSNKNDTELVRHIKLIREIWLSASFSPVLLFCYSFHNSHFACGTTYIVCVQNKQTTDGHIYELWCEWDLFLSFPIVFSNEISITLYGVSFVEFELYSYI